MLAILLLIELVGVPTTVAIVSYERSLPDLRKTTLNVLNTYFFTTTVSVIYSTIHLIKL